MAQGRHGGRHGTRKFAAEARGEKERLFRRLSWTISEVLKASLVPKSKSSLKAAGEAHEGRSYLDMCRSILKKDLKKMKELGYFGDKVKVRLAGDEATLKTKSKEVVVFRNFF